MSIEIAKDSLNLNQIIEQKKDSFIIEDDCIVPDIKPDILNIINYSGTVCIYKKEIMDGKIKIDGSVNAYLMYLADTEENEVRSLNTNLDFSKVIEINNINNNMTLDVNVVLKAIDCRILNGRKINIKATLGIEVKVLSNESVEYINEIKNVKDVQCLKKDFQINSLIGSGSTKIYAKDTLTIDQVDNLVEIMKADLKIINKDTKISYNKVLIKLDLAVKLLYLTEDNRINMVEGIIPIMGFIDLPNISDNHTCDVKYEIKNIIVKPNNVEDHSVYVEAEVEAFCEAYENRSINIIQDLYSPSMDLSFKQKSIKVMQTKKVMQQTCNIREQQRIPEIGSNQIYDVEVIPTIEKQTVLKDRILYEGEVNLNFIYAKNKTNGIDTKKIVIPFNFNMEFEGVNPNMSIDTIIEITMQDFIVMPDETIEVKIDLKFNASTSTNANISIIEEIEQSQKANLQTYSMIIYFTKEGDTLWKIAKRFNSTVEKIQKLNEIENVHNLPIGRQLFIPRYHG